VGRADQASRACARRCGAGSAGGASRLAAGTRRSRPEGQDCQAFRSNVGVSPDRRHDRSCADSMSLGPGHLAPPP
jgi:hypothetical protein